MTLALFPVSNGLNRHFDLFGEGRLRQAAARTDMTHELCRIPVIDSFFGAIGQDFHDPPVGLQPYPHHGRTPSLRCRPTTYLIRSPKTLMTARSRLCGPGSRARPGLKVPGGMMGGPEERRAEPSRQSHCKVVDGTKQDSHQDRNRYGGNADDPPLLRRLKTERSQHAQSTDRE